MLRPAISSRNLTSLMLVGLFFGVYVAAGGKVEGIPAVQSNSGGFGTVEKDAPAPLEQVQPKPQAPAASNGAGLDTSRLMFGKKPGDQNIEATAPEKSGSEKVSSGSTGLDSLTDRLNKVGTGRRTQ